MPVEMRFPPLAAGAMSPAQRRVHEAIRQFTGGGDRGPFPMMLRSPGAAELMALSDYIRFRIALPQRLAELAILIHARLWPDQYEWQAHAPRAVEAGLSAAVIERLRLGERPAAMRADEAAVYRFSVELARRHRVADATFERAVAALGEAGVADLTVLLGLYVLVSYLLGVSEAALPPGVAPPLPAVEAPLPLD